MGEGKGEETSSSDLATGSNNKIIALLDQRLDNASSGKIDIEISFEKYEIMVGLLTVKAVACKDLVAADARWVHHTFHQILCIFVLDF